MQADGCGASVLLAREAPCGEYAIATKEPLWSALLVEPVGRQPSSRVREHVHDSPGRCYSWRRRLREEGPNWASARAEQALSRTTPPLPRTTPAPRASRRRAGSSGLRNGHEARATSLQIKRLLLSLAKCAASAGVRGSKPLGATRAALTVPRAAPCRAHSALEGRRGRQGH